MYSENRKEAFDALARLQALAASLKDKLTSDKKYLYLGLGVLGGVGGTLLLNHLYTRHFKKDEYLFRKMLKDPNLKAGLSSLVKARQNLILAQTMRQQGIKPKRWWQFWVTDKKSKALAELEKEGYRELAKAREHLMASFSLENLHNFI